MPLSSPSLAPESESSLRKRVFVVFAFLTLIIGGLFVSEGYYAAVDFGRRMEQEAFETGIEELADHILKAHPKKLPESIDSHITENSALYIIQGSQRRLLASRLPEATSGSLPEDRLSEISSHATTAHAHTEAFVEEHLLILGDAEYTWSYHDIRQHGVLLAIKKLATPRIARESVLVRLATSSVVIFWIGFWAAFGVALFVAKRVARSNEIIVRAAHVDPITQLPNQNLLISELESAAETDHPLALLMVSVTNLDLFAHTYGNRTRLALSAHFGRKLADNLKITHLEKDAVTGRYDGNCFFVLMKGTTITDAESFARHLLSVFNEPIIEGAASLLPSLATGVARAESTHDQPLDIISQAMLAMQAAEDEHTSIRVYGNDIGSVSRRKMSRSAELMRALKSREFVLLYQPKIRLDDRKIIGVEALVRWEHPADGRLAPAEFIDLIETSSIARLFTQYIIDCALWQVREWHAKGLKIPVAINLSPYDLSDEHLLTYLETRLESEDFARELIEFELTETATTINVRKISQAFQRLQAMGVARSIDDFGTGMSSLSYLRQIPFTTVKIDRAFIRDVNSDATSQAIVESVLSMARKIGWSVVAEGIETEDTAAQLRHMGCHYGQGFLFSKPVSADEITAMIQAQSGG